jgi:hypothetical protein
VWEMPEGRVEWYSAMAQEAAGVRLDFDTEGHRNFEAGMDGHVAKYQAAKAARATK